MEHTSGFREGWTEMFFQIKKVHLGYDDNDFPIPSGALSRKRLL